MILTQMDDEELKAAYFRAHHDWSAAQRREQLIFDEMKRRKMIDEETGLPR